jgi:hypothetical protein
MTDFLTRRRRPALSAVLAAGVLVAAAGCAGHTGAHDAKGSAATTPSAVATTSTATTSATSGGSVTSAAGGPTAPATGAASQSQSQSQSAEGSPTAKTTGPHATSSKPTAPASPPPAGSVSSNPAKTAPPVPPPVPPASLPNAAVAAWQPMGSLVAMTLPTTRGVGIGECAMVNGAAAWHEQGYVSAQRTPAQEDIFGFADEAAATRAYQDIAKAMGHCQQATRDLQAGVKTAVDATVTTTAHTAQGQAWSRRWTGVVGQSAGGPQTNHYYLVRHGATVILAGFTEFGFTPAHPYDTNGDAAVLTMFDANAGS